MISSSDQTKDDIYFRLFLEPYFRLSLVIVRRTRPPNPVAQLGVSYGAYHIFSSVMSLKLVGSTER